MLINKTTKKILNESVAIDGMITNSSNSPNGSTRYSYFDLLNDGFDQFTLAHIINNVTLTIETTNIPTPTNQTISATATSTDGTGATLVASTLNTQFGFIVDQDLVGVVVTITADATTPANVGQSRIVSSYTAASGTMGFVTAFGATTSGVTQFTLSDNPQLAGRLVSDPSGAAWRDVTTLLTGSASHTASGIWSVDVPQKMARMRIKRVATSGTNSCQFNLARGR